MEDIPMPILLDPDRPRLRGQEDASTDDRAQQAGALEKALEDVSEYGQTLWHQVDAARRYLLDALPDPDGDTDEKRLLTAPRGPDDEDGWAAWVAAYGSLTSALAGPKGDGGFGTTEATREAQRRRGARHASPLLADLVDNTIRMRTEVAERAAAFADPEKEAVLAELDPDDPEVAAAVELGARRASGSSDDGSRASDLTGWVGRHRSVRVVAAVVGGLLVVRGLRPRRVEVVHRG